MPTKPRTLTPGQLYHVYNRSVGKKTIFHGGHDYARFIAKMQEYQEQFPVDILAFCLMPNHFHLLIRPIEIQSIDPKGHQQPLGLIQTPTPLRSLGATTAPATPVQHFLHRLHTAYAKYYDCSHEEHSGRVFQGIYKAKHVADDAYFQTLCAYIHDNPVRAKLVSAPAEWPYSSYSALAGSDPTGLCQPVGSTGSRPLLTLAPELSDLSQAQIYADFAAKRDQNAEEVRDWLWQ